jgi:peptide-methionine (R)-S-oxide reductase
MKANILTSKYILFLGMIALISSCQSSKKSSDQTSKETAKVEEKVVETKSGPVKRNFIINTNGDTLDLVMKSEEEWKKQLSKEEFYVIRQKGTERAFTGDLYDIKKDGQYLCKACNLPLFASGTKFDSGTGWPSFYKPLDKKTIKEATDHDLGYARTEVMCGRCGGHLGHVFDDGPPPTGLRYCINSVSLSFIEAAN